MNNLTFTQNGKTLKQINKTMARKAYADGKTVILCASNINPVNIYGVCVCNINRARNADYLTDNTSVLNMFKSLVNSFEFYNCTNSETGYYTRFYIEL